MKLYVGNLGEDGIVKSTDLRPLFERFGAVSECECIKNYAFVHMDDEASASNAVAELNGTDVKGRHIKVEKSESKGPRKPSQKLFIGNIREGTTNDELREVFERYCTVIEADVIKNFGFVHIDAEVQRNKVNEILRELNGYNLKGNQIRVQLSTSGGRGGDRDGGGGGGRGPMGGGGGRMMGGDRFGGGGGRGGSMNRGGGGYSVGGPMRGHNGAFGGQGGYSNGGGGGGGSFGRAGGDPYPQQARPAYMRDPMGGGGGGGGYDQGAGGYGQQGFAAAPQAQVGGYERRIGGAALPPNMYGAGPGVSNQPALPAAGAPQMRQPDYGGMRNDPYYPPQQQQPMAAQPNPYGQGPDPYGQPQAQPAPYSYSTGAANPDMYSRRSPDGHMGGGYGQPQQQRGPPGGGGYQQQAVGGRPMGGGGGYGTGGSQQPQRGGGYRMY